MRMDLYLNVSIGLHPELLTIIRAILSQQTKEEARIMGVLETLQAAVDATHQSGEAARGAIARVAEDVATMNDTAAGLVEQVSDLRAQLDQGANDAAALAEAKRQLAEIESGLTDITDMSNATRDQLTGLDPIPGSPAPPATGGGGETTGTGTTGGGGETGGGTPAGGGGETGGTPAGGGETGGAPTGGAPAGGETTGTGEGGTPPTP